MRKTVCFVILAAALLSTGCVYGNSMGELKELHSELADVKDELAGVKAEVAEEMSKAVVEISKAKEEVDEELKAIDWADELFSDYYEYDLKPKRIMKSENGEEKKLEESWSMEEFVDLLDVRTWTKVESLPDGLEPECAYYLQQERTVRAGQKSKGTGRFDSIAKVLLYKDSNYVSVAFMEELETKTFGIIPKEYLISVYQVPQGIVDQLKN